MSQIKLLKSSHPSFFSQWQLFLISHSQKSHPWTPSLCSIQQRRKLCCLYLENIFKVLFLPTGIGPILIQNTILFYVVNYNSPLASTSDQCPEHNSLLSVWQSGIMTAKKVKTARNRSKPFYLYFSQSYNLKDSRTSQLALLLSAGLAAAILPNRPCSFGPQCIYTHYLCVSRKTTTCGWFVVVVVAIFPWILTKSPSQ